MDVWARKQIFTKHCILIGLSPGQMAGVDHMKSIKIFSQLLPAHKNALRGERGPDNKK